MKTLLNTHNLGARATFLSLVVVGGLIGTLDVGTASAATDSDLPAIAIHYDRRDLGSDRGVKLLYRRLVSASELVCPKPSNTIIVELSVKQCREQAVAGAVLKINNQNLTAMYEARSIRSDGV